MKITTYIITVLFFLLPQEEEYPYKNGKPTSRGIDYYVKVNEYQFVEDFQTFVKDTLYDVYIETDNLVDYTDYDSLELGRYYFPNSITITNETKFIAYEINELGKFRRTHVETNRFVRSTIMHELTHYYFYLIIQEMKYKKLYVSSEYTSTLRIFPNNGYGEEFIEEGVCEYMSQKMGEINPYRTILRPKTVGEIIDPNNRYEIKYKYASIYVKDFLDKAIENGRVRDGIQILLGNRPPTYQEIINSNLYFNRLQKTETL
jgi:hypothetical protein